MPTCRLNTRVKCLSDRRAGSVAHHAIEAFLDGHPSQAVREQPEAATESYTTAAYFGVNSFKFTNARDGRARKLSPRAARRRALPHAADVKAKGPNYLLEELPQRVARTPLVFDWYAQIAQRKATDRASGRSQAREPQARAAGHDQHHAGWRDTREVDRQTLFLPGTAHPGIEPADPMLTLRNDAYPISFKQRQ